MTKRFTHGEAREMVIASKTAEFKRLVKSMDFSVIQSRDPKLRGTGRTHNMLQNVERTRRNFPEIPITVVALNVQCARELQSEFEKHFGREEKLRFIGAPYGNSASLRGVRGLILADHAVYETEHPVRHRHVLELRRVSKFQQLRCVEQIENSYPPLSSFEIFDDLVTVAIRWFSSLFSK